MKNIIAKLTLFLCCLSLLIFFTACSNELFIETRDSTTINENIVKAEDSKSVLEESNFTYNFLPNNTIKILKYTGTEAEIVIPNSLDGKKVTIIGDNAFTGSSSLTKVTISEGIIEIQERAFLNCTNLTNIDIPESVMKIEFEAFDNTSFLRNNSDEFFVINRQLIKYNGKNENVTIPDNIDYIRGAFMNCKTIKSITIPGSVIEIGNRAFYDCKALEKVTILDGVTAIGDWVFFNCVNLIDITIPESVVKFGFDFLDGLNSPFVRNYVYSSEDFSDIVKSFVVINNILVYYYQHQTIIDVEIPASDGINEIGAGTFSQNKTMRSVTIPDGVTKINDKAFDDCLYLKKIVIPDSVTEIGKSAFNGSFNVVVYCSKDSYAYKFCIENNINIENI